LRDFVVSQFFLDTSSSTKIFGGFSFLKFAVVAEIFEKSKMSQTKLLSAF